MFAFGQINKMAPQTVNQRDSGDFIQPPANTQATQQNLSDLQNLVRFFDGIDDELDEGEVIGERDAERTCPIVGSIKIYGLEQIPPIASNLHPISQQSRI